MEKAEEEIKEPFGWDDIPTEMWYENLDDYSYTNLVMKMPEPPITEPIRRNGKRKVTLIELLNAFDQVRKDSEDYQILEQQRQIERDRIAEKARKHMIGTAHEDHLEKDVEQVWNKIKNHSQKTIPINDLLGKKSHEEFIKIIMSILFLAYDGKIRVYQKKFPFGKIFIKNLGYS